MPKAAARDRETIQQPVRGLLRRDGKIGAVEQAATCIAKHVPDVVAVQLVRDPRAIAWSWRRSSGSTDVTPFVPRSVPATTLEWVGNNVAMELVVRRLRVPHLRLRYEDLVDRPSDSLDAIATLAGSSASVPVHGSTATLASNHTVAGNPSRFRTGDVELRRDDEWRTRLTTRDRVVTSTIALPLLSRYGYDLQPA